MLFNDLTGGVPVEYALPSSIVGVIEANEQCFKVRMTSNIDPENLTLSGRSFRAFPASDCRSA